MADIKNLPYEEEAKLLSDIIAFFTDRLPHAAGESLDHLDEAALSAELFEGLSALTDEELDHLGIGHRDDLSRAAAAAAGLFIIAKKNHG